MTLLRDNLVVTEGGKVLPNQPLARRLFRDQFRDCYRIGFNADRRQWVVYHCGRVILDGPRGSVAAILDYLRETRRGAY